MIIYNEVKKILEKHDLATCYLLQFHKDVKMNVDIHTDGVTSWMSYHKGGNDEDVLRIIKLFLEMEINFLISFRQINNVWYNYCVTTDIIKQKFIVDKEFLNDFVGSTQKENIDTFNIMALV